MYVIMGPIKARVQNVVSCSYMHAGTRTVRDLDKSYHTVLPGGLCIASVQAEIRALEANGTIEQCAMK